MSPTDKVALVTGGGQGIGKAIAARLLSQGTKVVIAEFDEEAGEEAAAELARLGEVHFVPTDVAREAGCSQATVSFVLNRNDTVKISPQTRERVLSAARTLGYSPANVRVAAGAAVGTNSLIGFAVDQLSTSPEAIVAIEGARAAAWGAGNIILVAQTQSDAKMEPRTLAALTGRDVSALIYMTIFTREIEAPAQGA